MLFVMIISSFKVIFDNVISWFEVVDEFILIAADPDETSNVNIVDAPDKVYL